MHSMRKTLTFLLFLCLAVAVKADLVYPARCIVHSSIPVYSGPSLQKNILGLIDKKSTVMVYSVEQKNNMLWGIIEYNGRRGYIPMQYATYLNAEPDAPLPPSLFENPTLWQRTQVLLSDAWLSLQVVLITLFVILVFFFWKEIIEIAAFSALLAAIGALILYPFDKAAIGATIGLGIAITVTFRKFAGKFGENGLLIFGIFYALLSEPFYLLNKLQFFLVEPWRYIFKSNWMNDRAAKRMRIALNHLKVLLYIITTPLRVLNAVLYNILIHCVTELYDLVFEVLQPSSRDEGGSNLGSWIAYLPLRIAKYPIYHGIITIVESVIWTVIDTFIPAITMYHGTDLTAGQAITCSTNRNKYLQVASIWSCGTFTASRSSWGGTGVYFASRRLVARRYAKDPYRLGDANPVMIVCRVSLGRVINYALTDQYTYSQAGQNGQHDVLNRFGAKHGYTTGEWWNPVGGYWEFCMFDWKNRYNYPWRIRPIYIYNFRTHTAQHIKGGMQHWLFDQSVLKSIRRTMKELVE